MRTLFEIEAAAEALSPEQRVELFQFLATLLRSSNAQSQTARLVQEGDDLLLEAIHGAPPMTTENVKRMLEDWP